VNTLEIGGIDMTDIEKVIELYNYLEIPLNINQEDDGRYFIVLKVADKEFSNEATYSNKFVGYLNCYTDMVFDDKGKFVAQGFWMDIPED